MQDKELYQHILGLRPFRVASTYGLQGWRITPKVKQKDSNRSVH